MFRRVPRVLPLLAVMGLTLLPWAVLSPPAGAAIAPGNVLVAGTETGSGAISTFTAGATGSPSPLSQNAGVVNPFGVTTDSKGDVWVVDDVSYNGRYGVIYEFAPGSTGAATPIATIGGSNTELNAPWGIAIDSSGNIWVAGGYAKNILEFAAGANGNVAPINTIAGSNTGIGSDYTYNLAFDSAGNLIATTNHSILKFAQGATGNATPTADITGSNTQESGSVANVGLAVDPNGNIWVSVTGSIATGHGWINEFTASDTGNVSPASTIQTSGRLPYSIALDSSGNLYALNCDDNSADTLDVYAPGSSGSASPISSAVIGTGGFNAWAITIVPAPSISSISPTTGSPSGSQDLTINGAGFQTGATVTVGGVACTSVTVVSPTKITCTTPSGTLGSADVVVTNPDNQTVTDAGAFTYQTAPTPPTTTPPTPVQPVVIPAKLASTGSDLLSLAIVTASLTVLGGGMLLLSRVRRRMIG